MKYIKIFFIITVLLYSANSYSDTIRKDSVEEIDTVIKYGVGTTLYIVHKYVVVNRSKQPMYIWFNKEENEDMPDNKTIWKRFMYRKPTDVFSYNELICDGNVELIGYHNVASIFLKRIYPNETFIIQIISHKEESEKESEEVFNRIKKKVSIYTESKISLITQAIRNINDMFLYKDDEVIIDLNNFNW